MHHGNQAATGQGGRFRMGVDAMRKSDENNDDAA